MRDRKHSLTPDRIHVLVSFVSDAPATVAPTRSGKLLGLLRKVIDYGRGLAETLRGRNAADGLTTMQFGTADLALILRRITVGLMRAAALESRITESAARLDLNPVGTFRTPPEPSGPRPKRPPVVRDAAPAPDPRLAQLPTADEIAADVLRRPIGVVLADICRDLGIMPDHPLWIELSFTILENAGGAIKLMNEGVNRWIEFKYTCEPVPMAATSYAPQPAHAATGPP
jgi:hypothetical protein